MFNIGWGEWLIILVIVLVIFGGHRLPALGAGLGRAIKNFRKEMHPDSTKTSEKPSSDDSQT